MSAQLWPLIQRAYAIIGENTPIPADCGQLCSSACCQGDDEVGMLLFPGEAVHLSCVPGFRVSRISYMDGKAWLLCCDGVCHRSIRPLACRIFPLAPRVNSDGSIAVLPDPRGRRMCPLADGKYLDPRFRRSVTKALRVLAQEPKMLAFMRTLSQELDELRQFGL